MRIQTEIGLLPEDWKVVQIFDVGSNYSYGVGAEAVMYDGKNKYLRITDIDDSSHRYSPSPIVSPSFFGDNHILTENEIVVARTGASVGKSYIYNPLDGKLIYAGFLMKFKVSNEDSKYVFYHLTTRRYNTWVAMNSVRSGQPGLNLVQLKEFLIPLPPKPEQERIAAALTSIDSLIDNLERTIQKKKNIREGAMEELLSGKRRLPSFSGEWVEKKIGEIFELRKGTGLSKEKLSQAGSFPCVLYGELFTTYDYVIGNCVSRTNFQEGTPSEYGDVLFPGSTTTKGIDLVKAVCIKESGVLLSGDIIILRNKKQLNDSVFLAYLLSEVNRQNIAELTQGTTIIHLHGKDLIDVSIFIPSDIKEQQAISDILEGMNDEIALLQAERDKYQQIRSGMMDDLLTGKIRLKKYD